MKLSKLLFLFSLLPALAFGQALPIRNDTPTTLRDLGANLNVGRNFAVDQYGRMQCLGVGSGAANYGKAEDTVAAGGDVGVPAYAVIATNTGSGMGATGDYAPIFLNNNTGGVIVTMQRGGYSGDPVQLEDSATSSGDAGFPSFYKAQTALSSDATANDYGLPKTDMVGRVQIGFAPPGELILGCNTAITTATTGSMLAADASNRFYVSSWNCTNTGAAATRVILEDGDGTDMANMLLAATTGSDNIPFPVPVAANAINKALQINVITTGTSTICCFNGYKSVT